MSACSTLAAAPSACRSHLQTRFCVQQQKQLAAAATWRAAAIGGSAAPALHSAAAVAAAAGPSRCPLQPCRAVAAPEAPAPVAPVLGRKEPPLKVVIAGAGIGGLVLAVGLLKRGFDVTVLERDMTAIRGEGKYRGPIQVGGWGSPAGARSHPREPPAPGVWQLGPPPLHSELAHQPGRTQPARGSTSQQCLQCNTAVTGAWRRAATPRSAGSGAPPCC